MARSKSTPGSISSSRILAIPSSSSETKEETEGVVGEKEDQIRLLFPQKKTRQLQNTTSARYNRGCLKEVAGEGAMGTAGGEWERFIVQ